MNENLTEIVCIIDRSTSIETSGLVESTIEGFNSFLAKQKAEPGEAKMTVILFDGDRLLPDGAYQIIYDGEDINNVENLSKDNFKPKGMTALYDAIGRTIDTIKTRQENDLFHKRPGKTIVMIMTDGHENSSVEYKGDRIKEMIQTMEKEHGWTFLFLGAGIDAMIGVDLGVSFGNSMTYSATGFDTTKTWDNTSQVMTRVRGMSKAQYYDNKDNLMSYDN